MNRIASLSSAERRAVFNEAGVSLGLPPFHVEKDFWVCWVLGTLFGDAGVGPHLTFRGGTSLSMGWGLIERFSEDIDLAMARSSHWIRRAIPSAFTSTIRRAG
jgi:predicted nucleotidyltransferase component of viral defense system